ncbi:unnamed protein product, partial [Ixodes hexagonus]
MEGSMVVFAGVFVILVAILGTLGNLLTIVALARSHRFRNASAAFIVSLSAADLCFCAFNLPFAASRFLNGVWLHGETLCCLVAAGRYFNVGISLLSITAITVNRYVLIVRPRSYERLYSRRNIGLTIGATWLVPLLVLLPTLAGVWGRFGLDVRGLNCSIVAVGGRSAKAFLFVVAFLVPCLAIVFCYFRIFWTARQSRLQLESHGDAAKRRQDEWRLTRMVLIIFCSFVACYLPITIVKVADADSRHPNVHLISYLLLYLSACMNPLIYGATNRQYRQAYRALLADCLPTTSSQESDDQEQQTTPSSRTLVSMVGSPPQQQQQQQ